MAFGTITGKDEDDSTMYMPKIIRTREKSELINLCKAYLHDHQLEIPSDRTLYRYLKAMPAGSQRILKGINPFYEAMLASFEDCHRIIKRLQHFSIGEATANALKKGLSTAQTYIR